MIKLNPNNFIYLIILFVYFSISNCIAQSLVLKTQSNLIVISYKSNSEFDLENTISWDGKTQQGKADFTITGSAICSASSQVGYLFGVFEVNYNQKINLYSDLLDKREFVRIFKLSKTKDVYEKNGGQLYILLKSMSTLNQPLTNSTWKLTLRKATPPEIIKIDTKIEPYLLMKDSINNEREKEIYEREQKGYEYYYKYKNNNIDELLVRKIVDSISSQIKEPFQCKLKCLINSDGDVFDLKISLMNSSYQYLFYVTQFEEKLYKAIKRNNIKIKPITIHGRNFYSYYEFDYKHSIAKKRKK